MHMKSEPSSDTISMHDPLLQSMVLHIGTVGETEGVGMGVEGGRDSIKDVNGCGIVTVDESGMKISVGMST